MSTMTSLPFEIKNVSEEEDKIIKKYYKDYTRPFVRAGPQGYLQPPRYKDHAAAIYGLDVRPDDVWVVTFSRSGTTWAQELVWFVRNNLDYDTANKIPLSRRFSYIEYPCHETDIKKDTPNPKYQDAATTYDFSNVAFLPSPRYIKTHLPFSLLPPNLLNAKVLYVARDVRDVAISFFFMHKMFSYFDDGVEFKEFWELLKKDLLLHMPIFEHIEEAWQKRDHPNVLFLFYEDMQRDLRGVIEKVSQFFNKEYTAEQRETLAQHLSFESMKTRHSYKKGDDDEMRFMRKGKSGNWVNYFTEELRHEAEEYVQKHLARTDLRFPEVNN